jgi:hypothetical protein
MVEDARSHFVGFFVTLHEFPVAREESHVGWLSFTQKQDARRPKDAEGTATQQ